MTESLVDTDILSFYFKGEPKVVEAFTIYLNEYDRLNTSIITYFEIFGGLTYKDASRQLKELEDFATNNNIIHISEESARISGAIYADLRRKGIVIGTSDLLIAGIAIENDLMLITNNHRHFQPIQGLKIGNWMM